MNGDSDKSKKNLKITGISVSDSGGYIYRVFVDG